MIDYTIISDDSIAGLIIKANEMIRSGWTPLGGVAHTPGHMLTQAFTRPAQEPAAAKKGGKNG